MSIVTSLCIDICDMLCCCASNIIFIIQMHAKITGTNHPERIHAVYAVSAMLQIHGRITRHTLTQKHQRLYGKLLVLRNRLVDTTHQCSAIHRSFDTATTIPFVCCSSVRPSVCLIVRQNKHPAIVQYSHMSIIHNPHSELTVSNTLILSLAPHRVVRGDPQTLHIQHACSLKRQGCVWQTEVRMPIKLSTH